MNLRSLCVFALCATAPVLAGEDEARTMVEVRVTASLPGRVQIDRGREVGIEPGDRVRLLPFAGAAVEGTVESVEDRAAWVTLQDPAIEVELGTRGEIYVPDSRLAERAGAGDADVEHPPWEYGEEAWSDDMPLLAQVKVPKPEERPTQMSGRWYTSYDWTDDKEGHGRKYDYFAAGADMRWENPFQRGGSLNLELEYDRRSYETSTEDDSEDYLRLERLSYAWGGTRETPRRWEIGRFLQSGMPQFGVLDGVEMVQRLDNGDRFGASIGLMPEPDAQFDTGNDMQGAAFYRWVAGEREQLSVGTGVQKTMHDGHADRDLWVTDLRWYPLEGWNASASVWVDFYGSEDVVKDSGPELTQVFATVGYRWKRTGLSLTATELRFPELLRREYDPVLAADLLDNKLDRVSLSGWTRITDNVRLRARVDQWTDEDGSGGGESIGTTISDVIGKRSRLDLELFRNEGQYTDVLGGRVGLGLSTDVGSFDVAWELGQFDQVDFYGTKENLDQHRLRAAWDLDLAKDLDLSLFAENRFGDEQDALTVGFYLQRRF